MEGFIPTTEEEEGTIEETYQSAGCFRDIPYYTGDGAHSRKHLLNIFIPDSPSNSKRTVVVHVHGGGWQRGDKDAWFYGAPYMSKAYCDAGFLCVAVNYRLQRDAQHPAQVVDVVRALKWIKDNIEKYGGDPSHVFLSGHSAGGHIVSLVALHPKLLQDVGLSREWIKGVITISGIYCLQSPFSTTGPEADVKRSWKTMFFQMLYVKPTFGQLEMQWKAASPLTYLDLYSTKESPQSPNEESDEPATQSLPPFLVLNAQFDLGLENGAVHFVSEMKRHGLHVQHVTVEKTTHGSVTRSEVSVRHAVSFIKELLK